MTNQIGANMLEKLSIITANHMLYDYRKVTMCTLLLYKTLSDVSMDEARMFAETIEKACEAYHAVYHRAVQNENWGRAFIDTMEKDATPDHRLHYLVPMLDMLSFMNLSMFEEPYDAPQPLQPGVLKHSPELEHQLNLLLDSILQHGRLGECLSRFADPDQVQKSMRLFGPLNDKRVCIALCAHMFMLIHEKLYTAVDHHTPLQLIAPCVCMTYYCMQAVYEAMRQHIELEEAARRIHTAGAVCAMIISDMDFTRCFAHHQSPGQHVELMTHVFNATLKSMEQISWKLPSAVCGIAETEKYMNKASTVIQQLEDEYFHTIDAKPPCDADRKAIVIIRNTGHPIPQRS